MLHNLLTIEQYTAELKSNMIILFDVMIDALSEEDLFYNPNQV